jgi:hypothetical protein
MYFHGAGGARGGWDGERHCGENRVHVFATQMRDRLGPRSAGGEDVERLWLEEA